MRSFIHILGTFYTVHNRKLLQTLSLIYRHVASISELESHSHPEILLTDKIFFFQILKVQIPNQEKGWSKEIYQLC